MQLTSKKVDEIVRSVLDVTFHLDSSDLRRSADLEVEPLMVRANIALNGQWKGQLALYVVPALAKEMAAMMTYREPASITNSQSFDAVGEVANMIAGNLRPLIPGAYSISMPKVTDQGTPPPLSKRPIELSYQMDGKRLYVAVEGSEENAL